jgi:enamine deaminase RidA (YjgF/YER057c/UK114 family)
MNSAFEERLNALGITLPEPMAAVANYVPYVRQGNMLYISGQISSGPDGLVTGKLGAEHDVASGQAAARLCGINILAQARAALMGDFSRIERVVKLGGFVNATPDFLEVPQVINGCSDLMVDILGEPGRHARSAVACPTLPLGVAVEIDAIIAIHE